MKNINTIFTIILLAVMTGCGGKNKQSTDDFFTVDVTKSYPKKELILQDIMDVEYIALESTDEFVCQGTVLSIGEEIILVRNRIADGDIFLFDRNGKGLRKFNRRGQGPEEYVEYSFCFLDEDNGEIYINTIMTGINVYDLQGNFLRHIDNESGWNQIFMFNSECLIAREFINFFGNIPSNNQRFALLSKKDGSVIKDFRVYFEKKVDVRITNPSGNAGTVLPYNPIVPYRDSWLLMEPSSDTIFRISADYSMMPFMSRTPRIQSMKVGIFLLPCLFTDRYYFMETVKMEYDLTRWEGFPKTNLAYDRTENTIFEYTVYNDDFLDKSPVEMTLKRTTNKEIAFSQKLEPYELLAALEKGKLRGKLKEITTQLDEDSNPVIMLVKYKK